MKGAQFLKLVKIPNMDAVQMVYHQRKARRTRDVRKLNALKAYSVVALMALRRQKTKKRLVVQSLQLHQRLQLLQKHQRPLRNQIPKHLRKLTSSVKTLHMAVVKTVSLKRLVLNSMDVIVKRVNLAVVLMNELQLKDQTKKVVPHVCLNHLDVVVTVLHQLMDRTMKDVALSLDMVAVPIISIPLVDQISKIVVVNILPMDVVQTIKRQLEAEIMKVVVANMLLTVAVQIS